MNPPKRLKPSPEPVPVPTPAPAPSGSPTPLASIAGIDPDPLQRLESRWLRTAEDVLAVAAHPDNSRLLREFLGLDEARFDAFLGRLRAAVPSDYLKSMAGPTDLPGGFGLVVPEPDGPAPN